MIHYILQISKTTTKYYLLIIKGYNNLDKQVCKINMLNPR